MPLSAPSGTKGRVNRPSSEWWNSGLRLDPQVGEHEAGALDRVAECDIDRCREHRARDDAGVELAALGAGIDARRQIGEQRLVKQAAGKFAGDHTRIEAGDGRLY